MFISIIVLIQKEDNIPRLLTELSKQRGNFEIILINGNGEEAHAPWPNLTIHSIDSGSNRVGTQLNAGTKIGQGDLFLFLRDHHQLPPGALTAIERNLNLLPQTVGGNFHLRFEKNSPYHKFLLYLLKRRRYQGRYTINSGLFVRRKVYETLGGFPKDASPNDDTFAQQMEKYGPTIYLPETITISPGYKEILSWLRVPFL